MKSHSSQRHLRNFALAGFAAALFGGVIVATAADDDEPPFDPTQFTPSDVALFIDQYCATCHNDVDTEGDLDITRLEFTPSDPKNLEMWVKIYDQTKSGEMPPKEKRRPREASLKDFLGKVGAAIDAAKAKQ